jgi:hypothetical protein
MTAFDIRDDHSFTPFGESAGLAKDDGQDRQTDDWLTIALQDSFPCSDPISSMRVD